MKKLFILPLMLMTFLTVSLTAQGTLEKGYLKMELTEASSDNEQMAAGLEMLKGSETEYFFDKDNSLVKQSMMGGMVNITTLVENKTEGINMFFDMMGQKMHVETSTEEMEKSAESGQADAMGEMKVTYDEADTKEILGYKCKKANITSSGAEGFTFGLYVTEDIKASPKMIQGLQKVDLKGFPLELVIDMGQMKMVYTTTEIKKEVDPAAFKISADGYKKMSFEEFQESMGAMGGGMGF